MEIKVTYQGVEKAVIDFQVRSTIALMRKLGYASFNVRSRVAHYEAFARFKNEDTDEYIIFYPDKSFSKMNDGKVTYEELDTIKDILCYYVTCTTKEKESEKHEKESE